mgnify:CR=1 FL=1
MDDLTKITSAIIAAVAVLMVPYLTWRQDRKRDRQKENGRAEPDPEMDVEPEPPQAGIHAGRHGAHAAGLQ